MNQSHKVLLFILVIAFILRLGFVFGTRAYVDPETVEAGVIAHALATGRGFSFAGIGSQEFHPTAIQAPVFPVVLGGMYFLFGENDLAHLMLELMQTILSVWLCYLIYRIGAIIFNETTGLLAACGAAWYPIFIIYSGRTANTMISIVTVTWFIYLFLKFTLADNSRIKMGTAILLGFSTGLAILSEPIMLSFVFICWLWYVFVSKRNRSPCFRRGDVIPAKAGIRKFKFLLVAGLFTAAIVLPWTIRNYLVFHRFVPVRTMFGINLWHGNNPHATGTDTLPNGRPMYEYLPPEYTDSRIPEPERDASILKLAKEYIVSHPGAAVQLFLKKCYYFWWFPPKEIVSPAAAQYAKLMRIPFFILLIFVLIGTGFAIRNKIYSPLLLFWLLFLSYMLVYGITHFGHVRYRAPIEPFFMVLSAYGLITLISKFKSACSHSRNSGNPDEI
ncbi:MAG: glycosyltransferase family 39 protein [bacterium]|nr:glycosyltransferase family 39 protein [bacterium]